MRKLMLFPVLVLLLCFAPPGKKNDLFNENLKGRVKSIVRFTFSKSVENKDQPDADRGVQLSKSRVSYNTKGNMVSYYTWTSEGVRTQRDTFYYDAKDNLLRVFYYNGKEHIFRRVFFKYNEAGQTKESTTYRGDSIFQKAVYEYNANVTTQNNYSGKGELKSKIVTTYNNIGRKTSVQSYSAAGVLTEETTFEFDEQGNIIKKKTGALKKGQQQIEEEATEYNAYDEAGNWIKITWNISNDKDIYTAERIITYY